PFFESRAQPTDRDRTGNRRLVRIRIPTAGENRLGDERLLVPEAAPRRLEFATIVGTVDRLERLAEGAETVCLPYAHGDGIGRVGELIEHQLDGGRDLPGRKRLGGRVDRDQRAGQPRLRRVAVDDLDLGVKQLQLVAVRVDLAGEQSVHALVHAFEQPALVEERE